MPKGFFDTSDPNKASDEFDKAPAGDYSVNKVSFFRDASGFPEWMNDMIKGRVARLRLTTTDGAYELPMSGGAVDLVLLARAFGVPVKSLPTNRNTVEFLVRVEDAINKSGKTVRLKVNEGGWVSFVYDATPPEGYYRFRMARASSTDRSEPIHFAPSPNPLYEPSINLFIEIVGDVQGKKTPFDGYTVMLRMYNPFEGHSDGRPNMRVNPNGGTPAVVKRLYKFIEAFCPDVYEHEWQDDMLQSDLGICEVENPIAVVVDYALKSNREAIGHFAPTKKSGRMTVDFLTLASLDSDEEEDVEQNGEDDTAMQQAAFIAEHENLSMLAGWIDKQAPGAFVSYPPTCPDDLKLTEAGRAWASDNLRKLYFEDAKLPPPANGQLAIGEFSEEVAEKLCQVVGILSSESISEGSDLPSELEFA